MCSTAAIGPAIGAIGNAAQVSQANAEKRKKWNRYLKVREQRWMRRRTTFKNKKVQFEQEVDASNIAAQRAYSAVDTKLYNARSLAILENQEDFLKMIKGSGDLQAQFASRGISGKSLAKALVTNQSQFGMSQALRARGLTMAYQQAKDVKASTRNRLKANLNRSFSRVSQVMVEPIPEAPPTMGNPGMTFMLGMGQAVAAGIGGMDQNTMGANPPTDLTNTVTAPSAIDYGNTVPAGSFGIGSTAADYTAGAGYNFMPSMPAYGFGNATDNFTGYY